MSNRRTKTSGPGKILNDASRLMKKSNYREAKVALEKGLSLYPEDTQLLEQHLECSLELKRPQEALMTLEKLTRFKSSSRNAWAEKGFLHLLLDENREGIQALTESLKLEPRNGRLWELLALGYMAEERWEQALFTFESALMLEPNSAMIWYNSAVCRLFLDDIEGALACAELAFALDPGLRDIAEDWFEMVREMADEIPIEIIEESDWQAG